MNFWRSMEGLLEAELVSADPGQALQFLNQQNIRLYGIEAKDDLTIRFFFLPADQKKVMAICKKRGFDLKLLNRRGLRFALRQFLDRPVLLAGLLMLLSLTVFLPTRVLFFQVEGNDTIPERRILEAAADCGIGFGASRRAVRSEKMKNALLDALPELKWAGINTAGCTATISVRERSAVAERKPTTGVSSIVASRDGYITSCTVTKGNGLCSVGQVVKQGQMLISGYTDCGLCIQATEAEGEIFAQTSRGLTMVTPSECVQRCEEQGQTRNYSLVIGKKRINFWNNSRISEGTCGRMYEEYYITLPGGFQLPVCLAVETVISWDTESKVLAPEDVQEEMADFARRMVLRQMHSGHILREVRTLVPEDGIFHLQADYICMEMIGRVITEEIGDFNGKIS